MFGGIAATTIWLIALPFCRFEQRALLERFHLQTESFAAWCLQQPIPAMYNAYHRFEGQETSADAASAGNRVILQGTVNHFPVRLLTFGDNRPLFLANDPPRVLEAWSSYRGQSIHTRWTSAPGPDGFKVSVEVLP